MRLNEHQAVLTSRVLLVPYSEHHVPTYHEWMQDQELQTATASEPLTIEEEYAMQKSWRMDADKLTFIICHPPPPTSHANQEEKIISGRDDGPDAMFGDVNLFLYVSDDDDDEATDHETTERNGQDEQEVVGEVEIMIARKDQQGKGLGKEILLTFLCYIVDCCATILDEYHGSNSGGKRKTVLKYLRVKIGAENTRSIRLFQSAGFIKLSETPNYFGELELRWSIHEATMQDLTERLGAEVKVVGYR